MEPTIGEIRMFAGNFAPYGWMLCQGQLLSISGNEALYTIIGTFYGGDGISTFALPNLASRVPVGMGQGLGLRNIILGEQVGAERVTLTNPQLPAHTHAADKNSVQVTNGIASNMPSTEHEPTNGKSLGVATNKGISTLGYNQEVPNMTLHETTLKNEDLTKTTLPVGGNQPHNNMQPYLGINFIIAIEGIYPSRS
ncbi:phage tail protein [Empedobacter tilapiae]|uniref:Phage tail protein n=1 Tax=Empedobacter tilapiae TaxID=2491114 RepID=A0A4Z1BHZ3_9FLAO|nr:tail fiber protein [Empedobacter tilapiae]TGN24599.1 phage tail protein [Empedobacter tilapiae]